MAVARPRTRSAFNKSLTAGTLQGETSSPERRPVTVAAGAGIATLMAAVLIASPRPRRPGSVGRRRLLLALALRVLIRVATTTRIRRTA